MKDEKPRNNEENIFISQQRQPGKTQVAVNNKNFQKDYEVSQKSDIGLFGRQASLSQHQNFSGSKKKNFWDQLEDSFNDSVPRIKEPIGTGSSPEKFKQTSDSKAIIQNMLEEENDVLSTILNKIYLAA